VAPGRAGFWAMQVTVNRKAVDHLEARLERQLTSGRPRGRTEGAVMTADQAVATAAHGLRLVYAWTSGLAALLTALMLIGLASYEPGDLVVLGPLVLLLAGALAVLMRFIYRRTAARVRQRAEQQLPRMAPSATQVLIEASALAIGEDRYPWNALVVQALEVTATTFNDAPLTLIERLELDSGADRPFVLDAQLIKNGRAVVDETWRRLREAGGR
jgi:hypothetical protein